MKPFPSFPELQSDRLLSRIVTALSDTFNSLKAAVTNDRIVFAALGSADTAVYHGLNAPPTSWEVVGIDSPETVYESSTDNPQRSKFLFLKATGDVNVRIRFN